MKGNPASTKLLCKYGSSKVHIRSNMCMWWKEIERRVYDHLIWSLCVFEVIQMILEVKKMSQNQDIEVIISNRN